MSGMYELVFGRHPNMHAILKVAGVRPQDVYRLRDAFPTLDGQVAVYTRGGGPNLSCTCTQPGHGELVDGQYHALDCALTLDQALRSHPQCVGAEDDTFDGTYRTYTFTVPERYRAAVAGMPAYKPRPEAWQDALGKMGDPQYAATLAERMLRGQGPVAYHVTPDGPREISLLDLLAELGGKK